MANQNVEIEIRIPVDEKVFSKARERLKKEAKFIKQIHQIDTYFTPAHRNFMKEKYPFEWLSIRRRGKKVFLNYKHHYPEDAEVHTHADEFNIEVKKPEELERIFHSLNFQKLVVVEKEREEYNYRDELEIELDEVKDLGFFIEIEALRDFGSVEQTRKKIFDLARNLELDVSKSEKSGYAHMVMKKKGLI